VDNVVKGHMQQCLHTGLHKLMIKCQQAAAACPSAGAAVGFTSAHVPVRCLCES